MIRYLRASLVGAAVAAVLSSSAALADWSDNFDNGFQANWQFGSVAGNGQPSGTFSAAIDSGQLVFSDPNSAAAGGAGAGFGVVTDFLGDQRMAGDINPNGAAGISPTVTLIARGNLTVGSLYAAEVDYRSGDLIIFRNDNLFTTTDLISAPIPGLTTDQSLHLVFTLVGADISASVYDAAGGTLLQSVSVVDASFSNGLSGVLANADDPTVPLLGVWDNVSATTIPEPTALALVLTVAAIGRARGRRAHR